MNVNFIVITTTITQSTTHNAEGILVSKSDPDSHFVLAVLSKHKTDFEIFSKPNLPRKQTREIIA